MSQPPVSPTPTQPQNGVAVFYWFIMIVFFGGLLLGSWAIITGQAVMYGIINVVIGVLGVVFAMLQAFPTMRDMLKATWRLGLNVSIVFLLLVSVGVNVILAVQLHANNNPLPSGNTTPVPTKTAQPPLLTSPTVQAAQATPPFTPDLNDFNARVVNRNLVMNVPLSQADTNWREYDYSAAPEQGTCRFSDGSYDVKSPRGGFKVICPALSTNFSNFAFQVQMTIAQGDCGGLLFRANLSN